MRHKKPRRKAVVMEHPILRMGSEVSSYPAGQQDGEFAAPVVAVFVAMESHNSSFSSDPFEVFGERQIEVAECCSWHAVVEASPVFEHPMKKHTCILGMSNCSYNSH